jgi:MFS transporter, ACS family, hexuronate transporter
VAPALVIGLYGAFGSWRPVFLITGVLGLVWVFAWQAFYHPPETHPRLSEKERALILGTRAAEADEDTPTSWLALLGRRETWGIVLGKSLTDPIWFFITDWFAIYLVSKGFTVENTLLGFWVPFMAADLGNFAGGGLSSWLAARGWPVLKARKLVVLLGGIGMTLLIPTVATSNLVAIVTLFAIATFSYAAWSTMALTFPADLYASRSVATVSGMSGCGAGIGTLLSTFLIGKVTDRYSFEPVLIAASLVPLVATALVFLLIPNRHTVRETC